MGLLFKFSGLFLIFCVCSLFGFTKSINLKKRAEKLSGISHSVNRLAGVILAEKWETAKMIEFSFSPENVCIENGLPKLKTAFLEKEDIALMNEFLQNLGNQDSVNEHKRTLSYAELLEKQSAEAEKKFSSLGRLYSSSGVLCGILICIFFI